MKRLSLGLLTTATLCATLFTERGARAAAFATSRFGGEHGNPTETNPLALYYNPAGLAFSEGIHVYVDGSLAVRRNTWTHAQSARDVPEPAGAEGANYGKATLLNVFGAPAMGASFKIGDLALGVGAFVPFGGRAKWSTNDKFASASSPFPLAVDGVQRWHGIEGALTFLYLSAGAAYKIGPLSIGVSGNFILSSVKSLQAKSPTFGNNDINTEFRNELDVKGNHGSFGVGLMFEAMPKKLWVVASYQAAPALGEMKLKGTLTLSDKGDSRTDPVDFFHSLPDVIRFGARFRPSDDVELRLFGDYTRWSKMAQQCIAFEGQACAVNRDGSAARGTGTITNLFRGWRDTFAIRAGASYWLKPSAEVFVGAGFETSAVPDSTLDPNLFDSTTISPALGGRFEIIDKLWLGATFTHIQYLNRDNTGKSILDDPTVHPTTRRVDGGGKYTSFVSVLNVNLEKQF